MPDTAVADPAQVADQVPVVRTVRGTFAPGQTANPSGLSGRPSIGPLIRELTDNGAELVRILLAIARDDSTGRKLRIDAADKLLAYGFGRPAQAIELSGELTDTSALAGFTPEEMRAWLDMRRSARKTAQMAALAAETAPEPVSAPESVTR